MTARSQWLAHAQKRWLPKYPTVWKYPNVVPRKVKVCEEVYITWEILLKEITDDNIFRNEAWNTPLGLGREGELTAAHSMCSSAAGPAADPFEAAVPQLSSVCSGSSKCCGKVLGMFPNVVLIRPPWGGHATVYSAVGFTGSNKLFYTGKQGHISSGCGNDVVSQIGLCQLDCLGPCHMLCLTCCQPPMLRQVTEEIGFCSPRFMPHCLRTEDLMQGSLDVLPKSVNSSAFKKSSVVCCRPWCWCTQTRRHVRRSVRLASSWCQGGLAQSDATASWLFCFNAS